MKQVAKRYSVILSCLRDPKDQMVHVLNFIVHTLKKNADFLFSQSFHHPIFHKNYFCQIILYLCRVLLSDSGSFDLFQQKKGDF